ncbi:MAG: adenylyltransferase/cytidyltransferase family protein [Verrucomicrobia bacterium]|nr:adenylyltransferase/cytidyltransferase family protein [Verrucomicrobiota bacterium]
MKETDAKILPLASLGKALDAHRAAGRGIIHCHGVFDLLHIGHIKHLEAAKQLGDILVVTTTPDRFVNKGPHRPAFPERLRAEALASLACVDYVAINEWPTAVETIKIVRPTLFVKGVAKDEGKRDHSNAINDEEQAVLSVGGKLHLTDEETFSASTLINQFMEVFPPKTKDFLDRFRAKQPPDQVVAHLQAIRKKKVLVIGESIVDEYQFCGVLGKSGKEPVLAALLNRTEQYAGGALAIANHVANFCDEVGLLSALGAVDSREEFVRSKLLTNVRADFIHLPGAPTIVKRRFLEEYLSAKLFEVYEMRNEKLSAAMEQEFLSKLEAALPNYDVVIVADYGHGLLTERAVHLICAKAKFLAVNTQVNAGNRGFNLISKYPRADFVSLGEPEVRLDARKMTEDLNAVIRTAAARIGSRYFLVTRGSSGCSCCDERQNIADVPAFAIRVVDRVGAGDAVLAVTSPCAELGVPAETLGFIANVVGAEACTIMGHRSFIDPTGLFRHITSLMK